MVLFSRGGEKGTAVCREAHRRGCVVAKRIYERLAGMAVIAKRIS